MKNSEVITLWNVLNRYQEQPQLPPKFAYAISRNKDKVASIIDALTKAQQILPQYMEYDTKRREVCEKYALREEDGSFKLQDLNGQKGYLLDHDKTEEYTKEFEALNEEYKDALEEQQVKLLEYDSLLKEEVPNLESELYKVSLDVFPSMIPPVDMESFKYIVKED
jgi:hypothetical protein